jgi:UDP:flavonoid glycosyltransferase YjiC (YdhE family)
VLVSLGLATVRLGGLPLVQHIADALAGFADVETLMTLDTGHHARLRLAPNVRVIPPTPLDGLVDSCDLVIHHGGAGTAVATLMAGLPHLLLPQMMDQLIRCEVIAASGAALRLTDAASQNDPRAIRTAVGRLLTEPSFRVAATRLRDQAEALPDPRQVASELEELAGH